MIIGGESGAQPAYCNVVSIVVLACTAIVGVYAEINRRRKDKSDEKNAEQSVSVDEKKAFTDEFGIIGSLGLQIAQSIIQQTEATREIERHNCDEKIAALEVKHDVEMSAIKEDVARCHEERQEHKKILQDAGLIPGE